MPGLRKPGHRHSYAFAVGRSGFLVSLTTRTRKNPDSWPALFRWMQGRVEAFRSVFGPRLGRLVLRQS